MAEDFADYGDLDEEGEDHLKLIRATALEEGAELFDKARQNLIDQYGLRAPDYGNGSGLGWYAEGCAIRTLFDRRLLCENESVDVRLQEKSTDYLELTFEQSGSYAIAMSTDDFSRARTWVVYESRSNSMFATKMGEANSPGTITEDYITNRLEKSKEPYYVRLLNNGSSTVANVQLYRASDGTKQTPIELLPGETHRGVAGTHLGSPGNVDAYYSLDAEGTYDIFVGGYVCGGSAGSRTGGAGVQLSLFEREKGFSGDPFDGSAVASSKEYGACGQTISYTLKGDKDYYVRVRNQNFVTAFRPAPARDTFKIDVRKQ